jgi:hypothetical protein
MVFSTGKHGLPGESGGNVQIIFSICHNREKLTLVSNGGKGSPGQDGGDGQNGEDGEDAPSKRTLAEFKRDFPTPAKLLGSKSDEAENTIKKNVVCQTEYRRTSGGFHLEGKSSRGENVTMSAFFGWNRDFVALCEGNMIWLTKMKGVNAKNEQKSLMISISINLVIRLKTAWPKIWVKGIIK